MIAHEWIVITGSRETSLPMYVALSAVLEGVALENRTRRSYGIIAGDAPGIDEAVFKRIKILRLPYEYWGANGKLRYQGGYGRACVHMQGYLARDSHMAGIAQYGVAIWNGVSRGTFFTACAAADFGKPVWIFDARIPGWLPGPTATGPYRHTTRTIPIVGGIPPFALKRDRWDKFNWFIKMPKPTKVPELPVDLSRAFD